MDVTLIDSMGSDLTVCNAARVSFAKETEWGVDEDVKKRLDESQCHYSAECVQKLKESDEKLIRYLAKHNHWSPSRNWPKQSVIQIMNPVLMATGGFINTEWMKKRNVNSS